MYVGSGGSCFWTFYVRISGGKREPWLQGVEGWLLTYLYMNKTGLVSLYIFLAHDVQDNGKTSPKSVDDIDDGIAGLNERYYQLLDKEQRKRQPKKEVVNQYLNLEYASRRRLIQATKRECRPAKILDSYPCFKDANEVSSKCTKIIVYVF